MSTKRKPWKPWGDHPVVVLIFLIAALIPIMVFVRENLSSRTINQNSTLVIRVADDAGSSVSSAKVIFLSADKVTSQYTDENGTVSFNVPLPNSNPLRVIVEAEGFQIYEVQLQELPKEALNVRLAGRQGQRTDVILRVVDSKTESPISNAEISVVSSGDLFKEISDSDGFVKFTLDFPANGKVDAQISVSAENYKIENEIRTLLPGKLQYVLLSTNTLSVQVPDIPTTGQAPIDKQEPTPLINTENDGAVLVGSGVEISQKEGEFGLKIIILKPNSQAWENVYVEAYEQIADASGNPSRGNRVNSGYINRQGELHFELPEGKYAICPSENRGYGWTKSDCIYNIPITANTSTTVKLQGGQIEFAIVDANGKPWENVYLDVFTQKLDVNGNPVTSERVWSGYTANTGIADIWLTPGLYALSIDLRGYNWGDLSDRRGEVNIPVQKATKTPLLVRMGQIIVGLTKSDGSPNANIYVEVYTQKNDVTGKPVTVDRIWSAYTDNGGLAVVDLTQGMYVVKIGDNILYDVPVNWGKITQTDGLSYQQK